MTLFNKNEQSKNTQSEQPETLGKRIADRRKRHNLTQEEFSVLLGVTAQAVSKWENDVSCPDIMLLPKIAEILEVSIDELMGVKTDFSNKEQMSLSEAVDVSKLKFRVHIIDNRGKPIKIALPMSFVLKLANVGIKISGIVGTSAVDDLQLGQILELVKNGVTGEVFDLTADDGTNVKIEIS